ncbi:MAG: hypothetical protein JWP71_2737 [Mucilaginibacter sp.]|nr:hypothetical protein [Mucilaginibacter sp.]
MHFDFGVTKELSLRHLREYYFLWTYKLSKFHPNINLNNKPHVIARNEAISALANQS